MDDIIKRNKRPASRMTKHSRIDNLSVIWPMVVWWQWAFRLTAIHCLRDNHLPSRALRAGPIRHPVVPAHPLSGDDDDRRPDEPGAVHCTVRRPRESVPVTRAFETTSPGATLSGNSKPPRAWPRWLWREAFTIVLLAGLLWALAGIFERGLWSPDEPREAEVGREMLVSRWSPLPRLDGDPFLEKPPLFVWLMAAGYELLGVSAASARVPGALFSVGSLLVAYFLGRRVGGRWAGLAAAAVLAATFGFAEVAHSSVNDTLLILLVASGHLALLQAREQDRLSGRMFLLLAGLAGLAFLTKGFIGPLLLGAPALLAFPADREWKRFTHFAPRVIAACVGGTIVLGLPWVLALAHAGGWAAVRVCLIDNTIGRSLPGGPASFGHAHGPLYYLGAIPLDLMPWTLALPAVLLGAILRRDHRRGAARFLAWSVAAGVLLLSLPATKRGLYVVPLYPALAAVIGTWLSRVGSRAGSRLDRPTLVVLLLACAVIAAAAAAFCGALAWGQPPSARYATAFQVMARSNAHGPELVVMIAAIGFVVLAGLTVLAARRQRTAVAAAATAALWPGVFLLLWGFVLPLLDPLKNMDAGASEIATHVPMRESLVGFNLDETTRAVIPFYSGRLIENITSADELGARLAARRIHHLVLMDEMNAGIETTLRSQFVREGNIRLSATRVLHLYRCRSDDLGDWPAETSMDSHGMTGGRRSARAAGG